MLIEPGGVTGMALTPCGSLFSPSTVFEVRIVVAPIMVVLKKLLRERFLGLFFLTQRALRLCKGREDMVLVMKVFAFLASSLRPLRLKKFS